MNAFCAKCGRPVVMHGRLGGCPRPLTPGFYAADDEMTLNVSELLAHLGLPDTPENQDEMAELMAHAAGLEPEITSVTVKHDLPSGRNVPHAGNN